MLKNITAALPGIAFQLALEAVSPLLGGLTKWAKGLETWINNARINSCETAKAIVSTAAESVGYSSQETCADLAVEMGLESDRDARADVVVRPPQHPGIGAFLHRIRT